MENVERKIYPQVPTEKLYSHAKTLSLITQVMEHTCQDPPN